MEATQEKTDYPGLVHVHVCDSCGRASRREEREGAPNAFGVFHCSSCGQAGPLRVKIMSESDAAMRR
jgi:ribosomal protein L37AE/L43A